MTLILFLFFEVGIVSPESSACIPTNPAEASGSHATPTVPASGLFYSTASLKGCEVPPCPPKWILLTMKMTLCSMTLLKTTRLRPGIRSTEVRAVATRVRVQLFRR